MRRWFDLIVGAADDLAGDPDGGGGQAVPEARGEILYGAAFIEWFAEEAKRVYGETIPQNTPDRRLFVVRQPIGVCAAITPWNFPTAMIPRKAAPAIAAGCTMVLKPASATPLSALALAELGARAGSRPACSPWCPAGSRRRRRARDLPDDPQAHVHRLDRGGEGGDGEVRGHREEGVARARRQRAAHRLRRRRPRRRRRGSDGVQVPQWVRRASARTGCSCRTGSTTPSSSAFPRR